MHFENEWYGLFARICLFQENWDWNCADLIQADLTWHVHNIVHNEYAHFSLKSDVTCKHEIYQVKLWQKMWFINLTRERKYKHGRKYKATQEQKDNGKLTKKSQFSAEKREISAFAMNSLSII